MSYIQQPGDYLATITEYNLHKGKTGSLNVRVTMRITHCWNAESSVWDSWESYEEQVISGNVNIVKNDGTVNEIGVNQLIICGWDSKLSSIDSRSWNPTSCRIWAKENGEYGVQVNGIYPPDSVPSASNVSADEVKQFDSKYGQMFRALSTNKKRNADPPKTPSPKKPPPAKAAEDSVTVAGDEIPFGLLWLVFAVASVGSII